MAEYVIFNGIRFNRYPESNRPSDKRYFRPHALHIRNGVEHLHREVWKLAHGPIPKGHHIHHVDGNHLNNDLSNLDCVPAGKHLSLHTTGRKRKPEHAAKMIEAAKAWHSSPAGRIWHSEHGKKIARARKELSA